MSEYIWLVLSVILFIVEALSYALVSIWFAIGAAAAMIAAFCGLSILWQWIIFIAVSSLLLIFTRKSAKKWLMPKIEKTNSESTIGAVGVMELGIENEYDFGRAKIGSMSWRVKSFDGSSIEKGERIMVKEINGVTLSVIALNKNREIKKD